MRLLIVEDTEISKNLIENAIDNPFFKVKSFFSIVDAVKEVKSDKTPFILIVGLIEISQYQLERLDRLFAQPYFKGIVLVSHFNEQILSVTKKMLQDIGMSNVSTVGFPITKNKLKHKIQQTFNSAICVNPSERCELRKFTVDEVELALKNDLFVPYLQAQLSSLTGRIKGFEILSRLCVNKRKPFSPAMFLDALIESEKITEFTFTILRKALSEIRSLGTYNVMLSLNVEYQSLECIDFAKSLLAILDEYSFPKENFVVEVTENSPIINVQVMYNLILLRMHECQLSIDDFGTQSSGFTELLKLPFTEIKIDKEFIKEIHSPYGQKVVKSLIAVAKSLGCTVVAEGVETKKQNDLLINMGVFCIQGYLYSKPLPVCEALKILPQSKLAHKAVSI